MAVLFLGRIDEGISILFGVDRGFFIIFLNFLYYRLSI